MPIPKHMQKITAAIVSNPPRIPAIPSPESPNALAITKMSIINPINPNILIRLLQSLKISYINKILFLLHPDKGEICLDYP